MSQRAFTPAADFGIWIIKALAGQLISLVFIVVAAGMAFRSIFHHLTLVLLFLQFPGIVAFPLWYAARTYIDRPRKSALIFAVGTFVYVNGFLLTATYLAARLGILTRESAKSLIVPIFIAALLGSVVAFYQAFRRLSAKPRSPNVQTDSSLSSYD
jgi:divalent metal cation (Fe/Co/Zn/Cd) transporter